MNKGFDFSACTSILVGKKATLDGSTFIARNEDAKSAWPKHMKVHEAQTAIASTFVSNANGFKIELPATKAKYTATPEWTDEFGLFEEDGFNEYGVAMSATESAYANSRVLSCDPYVENGISEEAMITVVLPYVKSARAGVLRLGQIVEEYGTSESNGILFADKDEVWYMETGSGHHWVAQRIPDDCYAVVANQLAIQEIDFTDSNNFLWSSGIQEFVNQNHLNPAYEGFNFRNIFGTHELSDEIYSTPRVWYGQKYLNPSIQQDPMSEELPFIRKAERLISKDDIAYILSSHFQNTPYDPLGNGPKELKNKFRPISLAKTQESHILQIRPNLPVNLACIQWLALGVTAQSVYVPFYFGATDVHPAYKSGQQTHDFDSAYWVYKLVGVLVDPHYLAFGRQLKDTQKQLDILFGQKIKEIDQYANTLSGAKQASYLTQKSIELQELGLQKYRQLASSLITQATELSPLNYQTDVNL